MCKVLAANQSCSGLDLRTALVVPCQQCHSNTVPLHGLALLALCPKPIGSSMYLLLQVQQLLTQVDQLTDDRDYFDKQVCTLLTLWTTSTCFVCPFYIVIHIQQTHYSCYDFMTELSDTFSAIGAHTERARHAALVYKQLVSCAWIDPLDVAGLPLEGAGELSV